MKGEDKLGAARHLLGVMNETGPISIANFMEIALAHPRHGYYQVRPGIGSDFITAPEISQLFGEMLGIWVLQTWLDLGSPEHWQLIELGPGRGTLAVDILRALRIRPQALDGLRLHLLETSPPLRKVQAVSLAPSGVKAQWHSDLSEIDGAPSIFIANEFFDALPIRQFVRLEGVWCERRVVVAGDSSDPQPRFSFVAVPTTVNVAEEIPLAEDAGEGDIVEASASARAMAAQIGARLACQPGRALIIDYGYVCVRHGDTLQAIAHHRKRDPLDDVGGSDLTAHVDFDGLRAAAQNAGASIFGPLAQRAFLKAMGIDTRFGVLAARADAQQRATLAGGLERLTSPSQMGDLFKVLVLSSPNLQTPPGFTDVP